MASQNTAKQVKNILCIGAIDSSAGTGLLMDMKTIHSFGCQASAITTGLYARNAEKASERVVMPSSFVKQQLDAVLQDGAFDIIKVGDVHNEDIINVVADVIEPMVQAGAKLILDPVMFTQGKEYELNVDARAAYKRRLMLLADLVTPNREEAEILSGMAINDVEALKHAAETLLTLGPKSVVVRGGGFDAEVMVDMVTDGDAEDLFESKLSQAQYEARGVGAALTAAIAANMALGLSTNKAVSVARDFVTGAIENITNDPTDKNNTVDPILAMQKLYELGI